MFLINKEFDSYFKILYPSTLISDCVSFYACCYFFIHPIFLYTCNISLYNIKCFFYYKEFLTFSIKHHLYTLIYLHLNKYIIIGCIYMMTCS